MTAQEAQQSLKLWMQVHNLSYANKASVRFNNGTWLLLNNETVTVNGLGKVFGGIGGAFSTLKLQLNIPAGALVAGTNRLDFRFNTADARSIGYRVLKFNLIRSDGGRVIPDAAFTQDNPANWKPPYTDAASISEGEKLWRTRQLVRSAKDSTPIRARCMDCHTQDGRDLKYFNYSNFAIIERSKFHGMTEEEGKKLASYIRTRPVHNPGMPWNPPYQPGPGLDSKPVEQWAAGAGIDAVLENDRDMIKYIFPAGITKEAIATTSNLSARQIPIAMQLPDWNHWLPSIHPKDAWGDAFVNHRLNKMYNGEGTGAGVAASLRELGAKVKANGYTNYRSALYYPHNEWNAYIFEFLSPRYPSATTGLDAQYSQKVYSTALWHMVKTFEIMQEFGLEGHQNKLFPSSRDTRGWFRNNGFETAPHMINLPRNNTGINNNTPLMHTYFTLAWWQVTLILYNGNHSDGEDRDGQRPLDWGYAHGFLKDIQRAGTSFFPVNGLLTLWLVKGMQVTDNTLKPNAPGTAGWDPRHAGDLSRLVMPYFMPGWGDITPTERTAILQALLSTWWDKTRQFAVQDWRNGGGATVTEAINGHYDGTLGNRIWFMLPQFKNLGVSTTLINQVADWAQTVWPQANWNRVKNATCQSHLDYYVCNTETY